MQVDKIKNFGAETEPEVTKSVSDKISAKYSEEPLKEEDDIQKFLASLPPLDETVDNIEDQKEESIEEADNNIVVEEEAASGAKLPEVESDNGAEGSVKSVSKHSESKNEAEQAMEEDTAVEDVVVEQPVEADVEESEVNVENLKKENPSPFSPSSQKLLHS
jgi:hypothetical protein